MSITLGSLCKTFFVNQSNGFEDVALNVDTDETQNLKLLLDASDVSAFKVCIFASDFEFLIGVNKYQ